MTQAGLSAAPIAFPATLACDTVHVGRDKPFPGSPHQPTIQRRALNPLPALSTDPQQNPRGGSI